MTRYSVQLRDRIFVKGYGFLSFAENKSNIIGKNISKTLKSDSHLLKKVCVVCFIESPL